MPQLALPFHSYVLRSRPASPSRLVNCFAEILPKGAKRPYALVRAPGIASWTTVGTGPIIATHKALGYLWVVSGTKLYRVDSNKTVTEIGTVGTAARVKIVNNITTIVVVNQPNAYYYDTSTSTFGQITDADFTSRGALDAAFLDNYLLFVEPNTGRFFCSNVGSATSFDALNFATAEAAPDNLVGLIVDHRQVLLLGEETVEIWELVGGGGFPFARAANGFIEQGCFNGMTAAKQDNSVFWLAQDYTVRRLDGVTPVRISQTGIEQALGSVTIGSGQGYSYSQEGHLFYVLTFPEGTFIYDATTREWHERETYGYAYWLAWSHAQAFGLELVGDVSSNRIGYLSPTTYDDWGTIQRMEWTYQPVYANANLAFHDRLEVVMETGVGLTAGQGSDPEIMMDVSDDGGRTWEALPNMKIGKIGEHNTKVVWPQLGSSEDRVYRGAISDPVKATIIDTQLDARGARPFTRQAA
jgi:hypothetical protein